MSDWQMGIDFGTSYTVAAVARGGEVEVVDVESNGRARIPSAVFLTEDGDILVGTAAQHQAVFAPERYEPTPKRSFGEGSIFLGDRLVTVAEITAAVLRRVFVEACRQQGETMPDTVRVTHPAEWAETRRALLREATVAAGIPDAVLVPEPVAAAMRIARVTEPGDHIGVYDFGGGTFDAAVLVRTDDGFVAAGPPGGRDPLGGEDIDRRIIDHLGTSLQQEDAEHWAALTTPADARARRDAAAFRAEVQQAKETLSEVLACQLWVPRFDRELQLTRHELDQLIKAEIDATVGVMGEVIAAAQRTPDDLRGLYLVGGSSRIPLVAETLWRELGVRPAVQDNPKSVVAMGAASWSVEQPARSPRSTATPPAQATDATSLAWRPQLAFALEPEVLPDGCECAASLMITTHTGDGAVLRVRDEPASVADADALADAALHTRASRMQGFRLVHRAAAQVFGARGVVAEFEFTASGRAVAMFEHYAMIDERAYVAAGDERVRALAAQLAVAPISANPATHRSALTIRALDGADGANVVERASLRRRGTSEVVTSERWPSGEVTAAVWSERLLANALGKPHATIVRRSQGEVLNLDGEVVTVAWRDGDTPMLTRVGVATSTTDIVRVQIELRHADQGRFAGLARQARRDE